MPDPEPEEDMTKGAKEAGTGKALPPPQPDVPTSPVVARSPVNRTYGRRHGHRLRPRQLALLHTYLPKLRVPTAGETAGETTNGLEPHALFARPVRDVWLEIGFGGGEHLIWQAAHNPQVGLIGCEPYVNGVARLLGSLDQRKLDNIRLHDGDARDLLPLLPPASIGRVFLLFPDPWPKKRHHKRRFVNADTLTALARILKPGGELRIASDIADYVRWTLCQIQQMPAFVWTARRPADWRNRPADWPETRYEAKALREGRKPAYLTFRRM